LVVPFSAFSFPFFCSRAARFLIKPVTEYRSYMATPRFFPPPRNFPPVIFWLFVTAHFALLPFSPFSTILPLSCETPVLPGPGTGRVNAERDFGWLRSSIPLLSWSPCFFPSFSPRVVSNFRVRSSIWSPAFFPVRSSPFPPYLPRRWRVCGERLAAPLLCLSFFLGPHTRLIHLSCVADASFP